MHFQKDEKVSTKSLSQEIHERFYNCLHAEIGFFVFSEGQQSVNKNPVGLNDTFKVFFYNILKINLKNDYDFGMRMSLVPNVNPMP